MSHTIVRVPHQGKLVKTAVGPRSTGLHLWSCADAFGLDPAKVVDAMRREVRADAQLTFTDAQLVFTDDPDSPLAASFTQAVLAFAVEDWLTAVRLSEWIDTTLVLELVGAMEIAQDMSYREAKLLQQKLWRAQHNGGAIDQRVTVLDSRDAVEDRTSYLRTLLDLITHDIDKHEANA